MPNQVGNFTGSSKIGCGSSVSYQQWISSTTCSGTPSSNFSYQASGSLCLVGSQLGGPNSLFVGCSSGGGGNVCFHKDTEISYKGQKLRLSQLKESKVCAIPHVVTSNGLKISTTCDGQLRLTAEHLVMTPDGWKKAIQLSTEDYLYSQIHGNSDSLCKITRIELEQNEEYFGLNCEESNVIANGYWVSTFGKTHHIPSLWMSVVSKFVGIHKASSWGDVIANKLYDWGLV